MESLTPQPPPAPPIVLIVEDDADTREMYHAALEFEGYWVVDATMANEALVRAVEIKPDIIVADIGLCGPTDGLSMAGQLRSDARTARIPLLAVTGRDPGSLGETSALFEEVLIKPVLPDRLSEKIKETLERSKSLCSMASTRVPELVQRSQRLMDRAHEVLEKGVRVSTPARPCPKCGAAMVWTERRTLRGVTFDYYRPCANGCGIFYYNRSERRVVPLANE